MSVKKTASPKPAPKKVAKKAVSKPLSSFPHLAPGPDIKVQQKPKKHEEKISPVKKQPDSAKKSAAVIGETIRFDSEKEFNRLAKDPKNIGKTLVPSAKMKKKFFKPVLVAKSVNNPEFVESMKLTEHAGIKKPDYFINGEQATKEQVTQKLATATVRKSQPYVFDIRNVGDIPLEAELLNPDYSHPDIRIKSAYEKSVTYREMLRQFIASPFTVGQTYIHICNLTNDESSKMIRLIIVETRDANCTMVQIPLTICKDPYQFQSAIAVLDDEYRVDTMTYLKFTMPPFTRLTISLYPSDNINIARLLGSSEAKKDFGNPEIIKKLVVRG